jgi:hypothetical protein
VASLTGIEVNNRLQIDGKIVPVEQVSVNLMLNDIGFAVFSVPVTVPVRKGTFAEFFISVAGGAHYLVFTGAVTEVKVVGVQQQVRVRELCAVLEFPVFFFLRRVTVRDVIKKIEQECRLRFLLPAGASYLDEPRPNFESNGSCKLALDKLAQKFDVPDAVWYQMPDGTIYWGRWQNGPFTKAAVPIEPKLFLENDSNTGLARLPCIPALRPGMVVQSNFRFRIDLVTFMGDTCMLKYTRL